MPLCTNITINGGNNNEDGNYYGNHAHINEVANFASYGFKGNWNYKGDGGTPLSATYDSYFKKAGRVLNLDWRMVAAHSYQESMWKTEAKAGSTSAGGLYQFINSTWKLHAPEGFENTQYKYDPDKATEAYIHLMTELLNRFSNAATRNDQILLSFQSYHDGTISGTTWANVKGNQYTDTTEGRGYVPKIMRHYERFGGSVK